MNSKTHLERAILTVLEDSPRAIPAEAIRGYAQGMTGGAETLGEIELALKSLERKGHAKGVHNADFGTLWTITDDGRLRLV